MNLFPIFRGLGYGLGFSDRGQKPSASGHWEEVRPSISSCPAARTIWVLWSFLPTLCSWSLLSYGVLAKSLSVPLPGSQFPVWERAHSLSLSPLFPRAKTSGFPPRCLSFSFLFIYLFLRQGLFLWFRRLSWNSQWDNQGSFVPQPLSAEIPGVCHHAQLFLLLMNTGPVWRSILIMPLIYP